MKPLEEQRLLQRCADNDRRAQDTVYKHYYTAVADTAITYLRDNKSVKSCVNVAFDRFFKALKKEVIISPRGWLKKVVSGICLDHLRKESRRMDLETMLQESQWVEQGEWPQNDPDEWYEECSRIFWQEIRNFAQSDQLIIFAKYYYQFTYEEIATLMDKDVAFLRDRTNYVRRTIRKKYKG